MDKRLMKLAGLLKEDINPYEDNNVEEAVAKFIQEQVQEELSKLQTSLSDLKGSHELYNVYDVVSSRGDQDGTALGEGLTDEGVMQTVREHLEDLWKHIFEWVEEDGDVDITNADDVLEYMENAGEFIGGHEGVIDYSGYPAYELGTGEESYIGIVAIENADKAENDYGIYSRD